MIFNDFLQYGLPLLVGVVTWFSKDRILLALNIKQQSTNIEGDALGNIQKQLDLWQEMLTDQNSRSKQQIADLQADFENSVTKLKVELSELNEIIAKQKELIKKQSDSLRYYVSKYGKEDKNNNTPQ